MDPQHTVWYMGSEAEYCAFPPCLELGSYGDPMQGLLGQCPVSQCHHHACWFPGYEAMPGSLPTESVWKLIQQNWQPSQGVWTIDP